MTSTKGELNEPIGRSPAEPRVDARARVSRPAARRPAKQAKQAKQVAAYAIVLATAAASALTIGLWLGNGLPQGQLSGLVDSGALTAWGYPIARLAVDISAIGTIGMLVTTVLLPREDGALNAVARRSLRAAAWLALAWGVATMAMLLLAWSDVTGLAVTSLPLGEMFARSDLPTAYPEALPFAFCAGLALIIAAAAGITQTGRGAVLLLVLAGYNLLPLSTTGHAQHSPITAYALTVHVIALTLWVGGLAGLMVHVRTSSTLLAVVVPRFSTLALVCFVAVGASGVTMAWANMGSVAALWQSRYGLLVLCKAAALVALGVFGWRHRRRTVRAVAAGRGRRAFVRLAAAEVVLMTATVALGVALTRSPTPGTTSSVVHSHAAARYADSAEIGLFDGGVRPVSA